MREERRGDVKLESNIIELNQIGEQRAKKLQYLGIETVQDLIEYFPRDYDDRSKIKKVTDLEANQMNTFFAKILKKPENIRVREKIMTRVPIGDETGKIMAVWYHQPYLKNTLEPGQEYLFTGKFVVKYGKKELQSPEIELKKKGELLSGGRIIPIYSSTYGLSQKILRGLIKTTLELTKDQLLDGIPVWIKKEYQLCDRNYAVQNIHFPESNNAFFLARHRLVFEELFLLQTALSRIKGNLTGGKKGILFSQANECEKLEKAFSFPLTNAQKRVILEIKEEVQSGKIMNRLVQGDVGSGKTAIAMLAAFSAIRSGYQAVLMAPTEVLASQHFETFQKIFDQFGIKTVLLSGSLKKKKKDGVLDAICSGNAQMVIGTHAVIQKTVTFYRLGLVITDEQHRFGVRQRGILSEKGENPHVLVMTATPIPRTLALILYGDLDISILDELPPGRQKIDTSAVPSNYHERIYQFMKREMDQGRQVYIICPMIEESEKLEVQAAISFTEQLQTEVFQNYEVVCLHGKQKAAEKQEIMDRFSKGEIQILVSTTVIEVGINVPNATIILIENAERFGLAQLHQLRGRVGRGSEKSYCILVCDSKTEVAKQRMKVMCRSGDGFEISEMDLKLRGPGEFFGTRQHGLPELKIANLYQDMKVLKEAQAAAEKLLKMDPLLDKEEHLALKLQIDSILGKNRISI